MIGRSATEALGGTLRVTDLVQYFGSTRAAARELGVSQRSVERYLVFESGKRGEKQARDPLRSAATRAKLNAVRRRLAPPATQVEIRGALSVNGSDKARWRKIQFGLSHEEYRQLQELAFQGKEDAIWDQLAEIYGVDGVFRLESGTIEFHS
jgi:hypothetical protein